jgi:plastocyanin
MSVKLRLSFLAAAVAICAVAFVLFSGGDDDGGQESAVTRLVIRGDAVEGGPGEITVRRGDTIRLTVESDRPHVIHMHGYDRYANAGPGAPALFSVRATIEGRFEIEVHETAGKPRIPVATLTVEPR